MSKATKIVNELKLEMADELSQIQLKLSKPKSKNPPKEKNPDDIIVQMLKNQPLPIEGDENNNTTLKEVKSKNLRSQSTHDKRTAMGEYVGQPPLSSLGMAFASDSSYSSNTEI